MKLPTSNSPSYACNRGPKFTTVIPVGFLIFTCCFLAWQHPLRISLTANKHDVAPPPSIIQTVSTLFQSQTVAPAAPFFTYLDEGDVVRNLSLPHEPRIQEKLGKKVLILDLETRPLASAHDYEKGEFHWKKLNHISAGVFNHYTYSLVHGYDYKFINATNLEDRYGSWHKPSAFANLIDDYKYIIFLDADATFRFMNLPIEWLINFWRVQPEHSITVSLDPWNPDLPHINADPFNRTVGNTGFVVVQNNEFTHEILKAWHECPDEARYQGCSKWKYKKTCEQGAFSEYVRYDYENHIKEMPCAEANGYPGVRESHCEGRFVRHYWFEKDRIKEDYVNNIMNAITLPIQRIFSENSLGVIRNQTENVIERYRAHNVTA